MIIKVILGVSMLAIFLYFISNANKVAVKAWKRIALVLLLMLGIVSIIFPILVNDLARMMGIGRGADLLLYATVLAFIFAMLNVYIKFKEITLRQGKMISKIALLEKEHNDHNL